MNMCSVRQRPIPCAPNSRALARPPACRRSRARRAAACSSAHSRIVSKSSLICGGTSSTRADDHATVAPSIVIASPSRDLVAADGRDPALEVDREVVDAGDAGLAHAARDDRRVRGHAAVRGEDPLRLDQAVDVVGRVSQRTRITLSPALPRAPRCRRRGRRRRTPRRARHSARSRRRRASRADRASGAAAGRAAPGRSARSPPRGSISPSATIATAALTAAAAVRSPERVWSM